MATQGVGVGQVATAAVFLQVTEAFVLAVELVRTALNLPYHLMALSIRGSAVSVQVIGVTVPVLTIVLEVSEINQGWFPLFVIP